MPSAHGKTCSKGTGSACSVSHLSQPHTSCMAWGSAIISLKGLRTATSHNTPCPNPDQPSLVTTHFNPRSHTSRRLTSGFHTLKGHAYACQGIQLPTLCSSELLAWRLWDALLTVASPAPCRPGWVPGKTKSEFKSKDQRKLAQGKLAQGQ